MSTAKINVEESLSKMEGQLKLWGAKLTEATGKVGAQAKAESKKQLAELKIMLDDARAKLDEAEAAGHDKWETLKDGVEHAWEEIESTFKKLVN